MQAPSPSISGFRAFLMVSAFPDDNLHAPNEKLYLPNFYRGIDAIATGIWGNSHERRIPN